MKKMIPDCYWPDSANGEYVSHEAVCVLNTNTEDVTVELTLYFEDRDKMGGFAVTVPAERTKHIRLDQLLSKDGTAIPKATPYAMVIECDKDVTVQYTRVDTTQPELAIATTMV
ncbi:MAG: sensory rhodopsin transducer [Candidatus Choladocola sp.]|nr:sensory rhodopsin transducer [Candidatus Choladocola sp.]